MSAPSELLRDIGRGYIETWRDAFVAADWLERLLSRLTLLFTHAAIVLLAVLLLALFRDPHV